MHLRELLAFAKRNKATEVHLKDGGAVGIVVAGVIRKLLLPDLGPGILHRLSRMTWALWRWNVKCLLTTRSSGPWGNVGRVWPRHGGGGRPLNSVVRCHKERLGVRL
jgi:hypothetical protein